MTEQPDLSAPRASRRLSFLAAIIGWIAAFGIAVRIFPGQMLAVLVTAALLAVVTCVVLAQRRLSGRHVDCIERDMLREVLEGSRGGRMITDAADHPVFVNDRLRKLCAAAGPPSLGSLAKLFAADPKNLAHFDALADRAHAGYTDSIVLRAGDSDNAHWFEVTVQPIAGFAGYIHWRVDDITERRATDLEIGREREKLRDFTDNAPVGFFSVDEQGRFVFVNATFAGWLGRDPASLLAGARLHDFFVEPVGEGARPYDLIEPGRRQPDRRNCIMKGVGGRTFTAGVSQAVVQRAEWQRAHARRRA